MAAMKRSIFRIWAGIALAGAGLAAAVHGADRVPPDNWWSPGELRTFPEVLDYANADGSLRALLVGGPMATSGHHYFEPLGPDRQACVTCHQPADAMSLSAATARQRWTDTQGKDPLFAAYDGANCPTLPQAEGPGASW